MCQEKLFFIIVLLQWSLLTAAEPPAVGCKVRPWNSDTPDEIWTKCQGRYEFPGNFNDDLLDRNTAYFWIDAWLDDNSTVAQETYSLPALPKLTSVQLRSFEGPASTRFRINVFLKNSKDHVKELKLVDVKLQYLTVADLRGFNQLETVNFERCELARIGVSTFNELSVSPSGAVLPNYQPKVTEINIWNNPELGALDWSVLEPISSSLKTVLVSYTGLTTATFTCSLPFKLTSATIIGLENNKKLDGVPGAILRTLDATRPLNLNLGGIQFCMTSVECNCCALKDFVAWLKENEQVTVKAVSGQFKCGTNPEYRPESEIASLKTLELEQCV